MIHIGKVGLEKNLTEKLFSYIETKLLGFEICLDLRKKIFFLGQ